MGKEGGKLHVRLRQSVTPIVELGMGSLRLIFVKKRILLHPEGAELAPLSIYTP